ncbi:MAG: hypothetical protein ABJN35_11535 [Erythrobacter sp.]
MMDRNYLRDIARLFVVLAVIAIGVTAFWNPDRHWIGVYYAAPAAVIGILALVIAVFAGARRLWLVSIPVLLLPIYPIALLFIACEFYGDCI